MSDLEPTKLHASYKVVAACNNCRHCARVGEYDCNDDLYCAADGASRPKSGSVAMDESLLDLPPIEGHKAREAWRVWAEGRAVDPDGWCELYQQ